MDEIYDKVIKKYRLEKGKVIGKGGYGIVYSIKNKNNELAMKFIPIKNNNNNRKFTKTIHSIEQELSWAKNIRSNYCIKTFCIYKDLIQDFIIYSMIMEKSKYGDLQYFIFYFYNGNMLRLNNNVSFFPKLKNLNLLTIKYFTYQILQSLVFLKEHYLIHCDIKAENFLLCSNFILKLCDFSLMKLIKNNEDLILTSSTWNIKGIEYYNDNLKVNNKDVYKIDIFSAGLIIYLLMYNKHIISQDCKIILQNNDCDYEIKINLIKEKIKIAQNKISNDDNIKDNDFKKLILSMIEPNISDRPNIEDLLINKTMNNDIVLLNKINSINENEEIKLFVELQKNKTNTSKFKRIKFKYKNKINNDFIKKKE